jgi:hypothetical protein
VGGAAGELGRRLDQSMLHNLAPARRHAADLARTLMICVILFKAELSYGVIPASTSTAIPPPCCPSTIPSPETAARRNPREAPLRLVRPTSIPSCLGRNTMTAPASVLDCPAGASREQSLRKGVGRDSGGLGQHREAFPPSPASGG